MTPGNKVPAGVGQSDEHVEKTLYAKQEKIYPREVHGIFARLRALGVLGLLGAPRREHFAATAEP